MRNSSHDRPENEGVGLTRRRAADRRGNLRRRRGAAWPGVLALSLVAVICLGAPPALAFKLSPFVQNFDPAGSGANRTFRVQNDFSTPIAVEITMVRREMAADGSDVLSDAEDEFIVFPPQMVVPPGQTQTVRVQWIGDPNPAQEIAYRIIAEQLPVRLEREQEPGIFIKLLVRYVGSVYIVPKGVTSDVGVESTKPVTGEGGARLLELTVRNRGTAHAILRELSITVTGTDSGASTTIGPALLEGVTGKNVLAGAIRRFEIAWPEGIPFGPIEATLKFTPGR